MIDSWWLIWWGGSSSVSWPSCSEASLFSTTDPVVETSPGGFSFLPGKFIHIEGKATDGWTHDVAQAMALHPTFKVARWMLGHQSWIWSLSVCKSGNNISIVPLCSQDFRKHTDGNGPEKHFSSWLKFQVITVSFWVKKFCLALNDLTRTRWYDP